MRAGQQVTYRDADGGQSTATVLAVVGAGASNYKTLDLAIGNGTASAVPHYRDAPAGPCWALLDEALPVAPRRSWRRVEE